MRQLAIAGLAVAIGVWACLPFSRSYTATPPIVGVYRAETGEPLGAVQFAIAEVSDDSLCASPALQTITDSAGVFAFPLTERHQPVLILLPIEQFFAYSLCARVGGSLRRAFHEYSAVGGFGRTPISLTCIEARTPNNPPVVCTKEQ